MDTATLFWGLIFGSIGMGFFIYGKKQKKSVPLLCGLALCVIPYFLSNVVALIGAGVVLSVLPFVIKG